MFKRMGALFLVVVVCASCITGVRAGGRCNTAEWGEDGTYALKCEKGRWVRKATKVQVAQLLIAIAKAKQAVVAPSSPPPTTTIPPIPNVLVRDGDRLSLPGGGLVRHLTHAGNWYGVVFEYGTPRVSYASVLLQLSGGANPSVLRSDVVVIDGAQNTLVPTANGSRVYVRRTNASSVWLPQTRQSEYRAIPPDGGPGTPLCASFDPEHLMFNNPFGLLASHYATVGTTTITVAGHPEVSIDGCSDNGRYLSIFEYPDSASGTSDRIEMLDTLTGTFSPIVSRTPDTLALVATAPTDDGRFVGVADGSPAGTGIWDRVAGTIRSMPGWETSEVPLQVSQDGTHLVSRSLLSFTTNQAQLFAHGPHGRVALGPPSSVTNPIEISPDLKSGLTVGDDGSLNLLHFDLSAT